MHMNKKQAVFIFLIVIPVSLYAHPHIFIENFFTFVFNDTELAGIKIKWIFDEMFSASLIMDFDINNDRQFKADEIEFIKEEAFSNLAYYNYFIHITKNNKDYNISEVTDFEAVIEENRVIYSFFVPLNIKVVRTAQTITAGSYDDSYYCYVFNSETEPVKLESNAKIITAWEIIADNKHAYWGETIIPAVVTLNFRQKDE